MYWLDFVLFSSQKQRQFSLFVQKIVLRVLELNNFNREALFTPCPLYSAFAGISASFILFKTDLCRSGQGGWHYWWWHWRLLLPAR
jgi:hypothetical protein